MAHTPGPWFVGERHLISDDNEGGEQYGYNIIAVGGTVAEQVLGATFHIATVGANPGDDECEDNVRLIAASPELLAVCKAIASDLSLFHFTDGEYRLSEQSAGVILQSLREVIAKAEGRTDEE